MLRDEVAVVRQVREKRVGIGGRVSSMVRDRGVEVVTLMRLMCRLSGTPPGKAFAVGGMGEIG